SRAEYDRRIAEWFANGRQLPAPAGEITVSALIVRFWEHAERHYRNPGGTSGGKLVNFRYALGPLRRLYGHTRAGDFGPLALYAVKPFVSWQVWAMIELQLLTGMRPGEVCAIRTAYIDRSGKLWLYKPAEHKTAYRGHERTIYLGPRAQRVVEPFFNPNLQAF